MKTLIILFLVGFLHYVVADGHGGGETDNKDDDNEMINKWEMMDNKTDEGVKFVVPDPDVFPVPEFEDCREKDNKTYVVPFLPNCTFVETLAKVGNCMANAKGDGCRNRTLHAFNCFKNTLMMCNETGEKGSIFAMMEGGNEWIKEKMMELEKANEDSDLVKTLLAFTCSDHNPSKYPEFNGTLGIMTDFCPSNTWDTIGSWMLKGLNRWNGVKDGFSRCGMLFDLTTQIDGLLERTCNLTVLPDCRAKNLVLAIKDHFVTFMNTAVKNALCTAEKMSCPEASECDKGCNKANSWICNYMKWRYYAINWQMKFKAYESKCEYLPFKTNGDDKDGDDITDGDDKTDSNNDKWDTATDAKGDDKDDNMQGNKDDDMAENGMDWPKEVPYFSFYVPVKCEKEYKKKVIWDKETESSFSFCSDGKYKEWGGVLEQWSKDMEVYKYWRTAYGKAKEYCFIPDFTGDCGFNPWN